MHRIQIAQVEFNVVERISLAVDKIDFGPANITDLLSPLADEILDDQLLTRMWCHLNPKPSPFFVD
ncbi:MAG: hypothetical protein L0322_18605 [Chloroflexi bacterium]|nr:hypothetical protein [Chloroflexota bacterium]